MAMDDISVEQILANESQTAEPDTAAPQQEAPVQSQQTSEYEYTVNGRLVKEPIDVILKRASQGYNYAQHMQDFKTRESEVEARYNKGLELETKYGEIDKFATENPEWNDHLQKSWQARFDVTGGSDQSSGTNIPPHLAKEINELKSFVSEIKAQKADEAYSRAVDQVKGSYPDIDFMATNPESGKTLEQEVLDFASKNAIGRFEPAFKAFYHDKLIERARLQAKDQLAADIQQRSKAGIIGVSQAPTKAAVGSMPDLRRMSYNDIERHIIANELN